MGIWLKTGSTTWTKMASAFMKSGASTWSELLSVWIRSATNTWTKIFDKPNTPTPITLPFINDYLDTNRINNTTVISNVGDTIYGRRGSWNYSPTSYQYKWQYSNMEDGIYQDFSPAQTSTAHPSPLTTLVSWNDRWVRYAVKATNATGSSDWILSSNAAHLIKYIPSHTSTTISGAAEVGTTLIAISTWATTLLVSGDRTPDSYVYEWTYGDNTATFNTNSGSSYTLTSEDLGKTLKVKVTATNTGGSASATSAQTAVVGQSVSISGVSFTDGNNRSGKDYNGNIVTAAGQTINFTVSGVSAATSFRVRYRILNNQTQVYYNIEDTVTTYTSTQAGAWTTFTDYPDGTGNMSSVTTVGSVSTVTDNFTINEGFNGSTYSGGLPRWTLQYEISVLNTGGTRKYWNPGDYLTTSQAIDFWNIAPASLPTITASSSTAAKNTSITFSGTLASYPAGLNSYPSSYKIDYGDGTDSGWVATNGTANPTYSKAKSYTADGTYIVSIETTPFYSSNTTTVTIADVPTKPTALTSAVGTGKIVLTFSGGTGSQYDIYWSSSNSRPADAGPADFLNAVSPFDASASSPAGLGITTRNSNRYFWVRKSTGTVRSAWYPGTTTGAADGVVAKLPLLAPPAPTSPNTTGVTETNITFNWTGSGTPNTATQDAHSGYEYYTSTSSTNPDASTTATGSVGSTITTKSFSYTASTSPTLQYFWVRAINADSKSAWTAPVSVKPTAQVLYTVSFNVNGGTGTAPSDLSQTSTGGSITLPGIGSMVGPSGKPTFSGWVTTTTGTTALTGSYTPTQTRTLYAYWTVPADSAPSGGSVTIAGTAKMRETLTATVVNASGYPVPTISYQWQANNGGTGGNTYANISGATSSTYAPGGFQAGYNIRCVVTFSNGVGTNATATSNATGLIEAINWTISYNANGGTGAPASTTVVQDKPTNVSSTVPTRSGYTFSGWATTATGTVAYASGAAITPSANVDLFAIWAVATASVSSIKGSTSGRTGTSTWNDPKSTFVITFANTTSATARIQRSAANDFVTPGQFTSGVTDTLTIASNAATITTNQPTGNTSTSANFYYRVQVMSMNGTTLTTPITSASIQNSLTAKSNVTVYP